MLRWAERLFILAGVGALGWCAYVLTDAYFAQRLARETLASTPHVANKVEPHAPIRKTLATGTPLAELSIPRLGLSAVVLHGSDAHTLRIGLGHIENTALPGESGNVAIAGHRDSFFRPLQHVRVGDDIVLDTPEERLHYRVESTRVVDSYEVSVIGPTSDPTLTLVTCYPFWFIGDAPDRFVVRATRVDNPPSEAAEEVAIRAPIQNHPVPPRREERVLTGDVRDDVRLVRDAVERFRVAYNARLGRHPESAAGSLVALGSCDVSLEDQKATAVCNATTSADRLSSAPWTFHLVRNRDAWTISAIAMD